MKSLQKNKTKFEIQEIAYESEVTSSNNSLEVDFDNLKYIKKDSNFINSFYKLLLR